jgi:uncharacterized membrane protein
MNQTKQNSFHLLACTSLIGLILLLVLWEMLLAPLRPGGSWMVLKVIPLLYTLRGVFKHQNYTMQWSSMLILLYFTEGVVRASSDTLTVSRALAGLEIFLSVSFFFGAILYLRPYKKAAKKAAKDAAQN